MTLDVTERRKNSLRCEELMIKASPSKSFTGFFKLPSAGQLILEEGVMNDRLANLESNICALF